MARVEWHPPDFQNSIIHRGVTLYVPIADALVGAIPGARRATLDGLAHPSPITAPRPVADAICAFLEPLA